MHFIKQGEFHQGLKVFKYVQQTLKSLHLAVKCNVTKTRIQQEKNNKNGGRSKGVLLDFSVKLRFFRWKTYLEKYVNVIIQ